MHLYNVLVLQLTQTTSLLFELLPLLFKLLHIFRITHANETSCLVPFRHALHEELFDSNGLFKLRIVANIRDAEAALP